MNIKQAKKILKQHNIVWSSYFDLYKDKEYAKKLDEALRRIQRYIITGK